MIYKNKLKQISRNILFIFSFLSLILPMSAFAAAGTPDTTFTTNIGTGFNFDTQTIAVQSDDKIIVGGNFTDINGTNSTRIARLNSDGTLDTTFTTNIGTGFNGRVHSIKIQSDGKIIAGGAFSTINGVTSNRIARLNSDGTPDTTFITNTGTGISGGSVYSIGIQSDGKIVLGGTFGTINGVTSSYIARLNTDGTPDTTFTTNTGTGFDDDIQNIYIQSDDKILAAGLAGSFNGTNIRLFTRLNSNGTRDTTFTTNLGTGFNNNTWASATQSDGKIIVGGQFTSLKGVTNNRIARLNSDGTPDTTFTTNIGTGLGAGSVKFIKVQSDDKIIVVGAFTTINGVTSNKIVRLNSDGTPDTTFTTNIGTGFGAQTISIALQSTGKIIVGGEFTTVNDATSNYLARLDGDVFTPTVTTGASSAITTTTATLAGNITATGNENSTARGVEYGLTTGYGTTSSESGSFSTGAYTRDITGLTCATVYHYRAYSTNTAGTGTGSDDTFTTSACPVVASSSNTSGSSAGSRASYFYSVGNIDEANKILSQYPNAINEIKDESIKNALSNNTTTENSNSASGTKITKKLIQNTKDNQVKTLQTLLNKVLKLNLTVDGSFGLKTKTALVQFQKANKLTPDGIVGPKTREVLNKLP